MFAADMMERWIKTDAQFIIWKIERITHIYRICVIEEGDKYEEWLQRIIDEDANMFKYPQGVCMSDNPDLKMKRIAIYKALSEYAKELVEAERRRNERMWDEYHAEQERERLAEEAAKLNISQ